VVILAFARNPGIFGVLPKGRIVIDPRFREESRNFWSPPEREDCNQPSLSRGIQGFLESSRKGGLNTPPDFIGGTPVF